MRPPVNGVLYRDTRRKSNGMIVHLASGQIFDQTPEGNWRVAPDIDEELLYGLLGGRFQRGRELTSEDVVLKEVLAAASLV